MKQRAPAGLAVLLCAVVGAACGAPKDTGTPGHAASRGPSGRIRGMVRLRGAVPPMRSEPTGKDDAVCGSAVPVTRLALGRDRGIGRTFVYLDGIEGEGALRSAASLTVEQKGCSYGPHAMTLAEGRSIEIVNSDPVLHNVHARQAAEGGLQTVFNIAQPVRGQRTKLDTHLKPGIVTLTCEAGHPWMTAYILVVNHPFVAVTDDDGRFVIEGVRAGTYPIKMWHEGVTLKRVLASLQQFEYEDPYEQTSQVVVPAGGEALLDFDLELRGS
jgi:plastocyanin